LTHCSPSYRKRKLPHSGHSSFRTPLGTLGTPSWTPGDPSGALMDPPDPEISIFGFSIRFTFPSFFSSHYQLETPISGPGPYPEEKFPANQTSRCPLRSDPRFLTEDSDRFPTTRTLHVPMIALEGHYFALSACPMVEDLPPCQTPLYCSRGSRGADRNSQYPPMIAANLWSRNGLFPLLWMETVRGPQYPGEADVQSSWTPDRIRVVLGSSLSLRKLGVFTIS